LLLVLVANLFGDGAFRIPGIDKSAGIFGLLLSAARGVLLYAGGAFVVWPLVAIYLFLEARKASHFRWATLWPVFLLIGFMGSMTLVSDARIATKIRLDYFFSYALPAMVCMLHCMDRKGIRLVRAWIIGAAVVFIVMLVVSGRLVPLSGGDMAAVTGMTTAENGPEAERLMLQSDTITTASLFFLAALAGLSLSLELKQWWIGVGVLAISALSIGLALFAGARGPAIAFMAALVVLLGFSRISLMRRWLIGVVGCLAVVGAVALLPQVAPQSANRIFGLLGQAIPALDTYGSTVVRLEAEERSSLFAKARSAPWSFLGRGVGSFGEDYGDPRDYAHNLFLEAYYETGMVGVVVIGGIFLFCFAQLLMYARSGSSAASFCLSILVFYFVIAQFSGTLIYNHTLLAFLVLGRMAIAVEKRSLREGRVRRKFYKSRPGVLEQSA
jgi:O-antigen ligase